MSSTDEPEIEYDPVSEATRATRLATPFDTKYREPVIVRLCLSPILTQEWVAVAAWGDERDNGGDHEDWPIRLGMREDRGGDGTEAEVYLTIEEAEQVRDALSAAIAKALVFP